MKQKKGDISIKSPLNSVKKQRNGQAISPTKGTPSKTPQKKAGKTPVKVLPPKKVEEEEVDDSEEEEDSGADVAAGLGNDDGASESEGQEEADSDEDDDENSDLLDNEAEEEDEEEEEDDEEDEEAVETPIERSAPFSASKPSKAKKVKGEDDNGVPKIKTGALPKSFPKDQVLVVKNLPKEYKQIDLVEIFAKFGTLHTIYSNHGPVSSIAYIAYTSPEEAEAAQEATNNKAKVKGAVLKVNIQVPNPKKLKRAENKQQDFEEKKRKIEENKNRTAYIKNLKSGTTEDQVREHFANCGEIEAAKVYTRYQQGYGYLIFKEESAVTAALNLHNSILNGSNIWVLRIDQQFKEATKDPQRTVLVKNNQNLSCFDASKLESIFSKCGEIESYSILCKKNVLAFLTFKEQKGAKKALKLNGTTAEGFDLEIEEYKVITPKNKTTVFVQNVKPGVTEEEIRNLFSSTGPIESVTICSGFAIVKFEDIDSFCKAFLLNESFLHGQMIFLEPYSDKKQAIIKNHQKKQAFNRKRPAQHNAGGFAKKRKST